MNGAATAAKIRRWRKRSVGQEVMQKEQPGVRRAFNVKGSRQEPPQETWDDVFGTVVVGELDSLGYHTLHHRRVITVSRDVTVSCNSTTCCTLLVS